MSPRPNANTPMIQGLQKQMIEMSSQWSIMKNEWDDMKTKVDEAAKKDEQKDEVRDKKLDRILNILENDDSIGQKGLVHQVKENSSFRTSAMTQIKFIAVIASTLVAFTIHIISKIFFK